MRLRNVVLVALVVSAVAASAVAEGASSDLKIFGYFQNRFGYEYSSADSINTTSFAMQQLNLFFQKDLGRDWSAFVNIEMLNNFSSRRQWGDVNLEEAWVRYYHAEWLNVKLGLQIPIFNNLNEIKNRTPLLPYIIRPMVYEAALADQLPADYYVPNQAFAQVYGFYRWQKVKWDYALYLGNSSNVRTDPITGYSGSDTTNNMLYGGRIGIRCGELKVGFSTTYDELHGFPNQLCSAPDDYPRLEEDIGFTRLGADLSFRRGKFFFESEFIDTDFDKLFGTISPQLQFYYATLGIQACDRSLFYLSFWHSLNRGYAFVSTVVDDQIVTEPVPQDSEFHIPTFGMAYAVSDRVTVKGQVAFVRYEVDPSPIYWEAKWDLFSVAISAFF